MNAKHKQKPPSRARPLKPKALSERVPLCPVCKEPIPSGPKAFIYGPFCSSRCRTIDLGKWLMEEYRIEEDGGYGMKTYEVIKGQVKPIGQSAMGEPINALKSLLKENRVGPMGEKEAAVALILSGSDDGFKLLFTQRPVCSEDPFSGQVCFPGGKKDPKDVNLLQTAIRETEEEVGLKLDERQVLGTLTPRSPLHPGRRTLSVVPFVFALLEPAIVKVRTPEVASYAWIPLAWLEGSRYLVKVAPPVLGGVEVEAFLIPTDRLDSTANRTEGPFNGVYTVWGLTFRILVEFLEIWQSVRP